MAIPYYKRRTTGSTGNRWGGTVTGSGSWRTTGGGAKSGASSRSFNTIRNDLQTKICSYQFLFATTKGGKKSWCPTPATISKFTNLVNKGAVIHKVTGQQVAKWAHTHKPYTSPTSAYKALKSRFGSAVKGVTYGPGGNFLVATSNFHKGKPFRFPK